MSEPKIRKVYKKILALAIVPFILTGCSQNNDCKVSESHVHKYIGSDKRGTVVNYINSEDQTISQGYEDVSSKYINYEKQDDYLTITKEDERFYNAKGSILFKGEDNWPYLFKIMSSKKDHLEYYCKYDDGLGGWSYRWETKKPSKYYFAGQVRVYHYRFCGHKLIYKDGEWFDQRSPFVDDIRSIINEYPYFQLDCYMQVYKDYKVDEKDLNNIKLEDFDEFTGPDLDNPDLYTNKK